MKGLIIIFLTGIIGLLTVWSYGLLPYIAFFLFACSLILIALYITKNCSHRFKLNIMVIGMITLIVFSNINIVKADAYDYDVYIHPDDLGETYTAVGDISTTSGVVNTSVVNSYDYTGKYVFVVVERETYEIQSFKVNDEILTPIYTNMIWDAAQDKTVYLYLVNYSASWQVNITTLLGNVLGEVDDVDFKKNFVTQYQTDELGSGTDVLIIYPFYPRYSEYNFMSGIDLRYPDINTLQSDYIGSNVTSNTSTRTIDDVGFRGSVYVVVMKNKTGSYPNTNDVRVSTDLWGSAGMYRSSLFVVGNEYYKTQLYRLGYIDLNPLSTSKDIKVTITDGNPSASEHLLIARYDPQVWNPDFYTYYHGYQSTTTTDYLINAYTINDYYANLLINVYNSTDATKPPVQDALVKLDYKSVTQQVTDVNGSVFYDSITPYVIRIVTVTHPNYYSFEESIYIVQGSNTMNVPLVYIDPAGQVVDPTPTVVVEPTPTPTAEELAELDVLGSFTESFYPLFGLGFDPTEDEIFKMMVKVAILLFMFSTMIMVMLGVKSLSKK